MFAIPPPNDGNVEGGGITGLLAESAEPVMHMMQLVYGNAAAGSSSASSTGFAQNLLKTEPGAYSHWEGKNAGISGGGFPGALLGSAGGAAAAAEGDSEKKYEEDAYSLPVFHTIKNEVGILDAAGLLGADGSSASATSFAFGAASPDAFGAVGLKDDPSAALQPPQPSSQKSSSSTSLAERKSLKKMKKKKPTAAAAAAAATTKTKKKGSTKSEPPKKGSTKKGSRPVDTTVRHKIAPQTIKRGVGNPKDYGGLTDDQICSWDFEMLTSEMEDFDDPLKNKIRERRKQLKNRIHAKRASAKRNKRVSNTGVENSQLQSKAVALIRDNARLEAESGELTRQKILLDASLKEHHMHMNVLRGQLQQMSIKLQHLQHANATADAKAAALRAQSGGGGARTSSTSPPFTMPALEGEHNVEVETAVPDTSACPPSPDIESDLDLLALNTFDVAGIATKRLSATTEDAPAPAVARKKGRPE